ncbi:MFS transporter [Puniceicoccaceae bacterium K14]|nr:MFS transporter [Puniceicoccaceae bacterium K14]
MPQSRKKRIFAWACFDFANSAFTTLVVTFIYSSYFAKGIALNPEVGTRSWGSAVAVSSLLLAVLSPALGAVADAYGWKKRMMVACLVLCSVCTMGLFWPQQGDVLGALTLFVVANVAIELSIVFNNAFLPEIAPKESHGKVSGQAWAFGYVGGLLCLGVALVGFVFPEQP